MPSIDYRDVKTNSSVDVLNAIRNSASQNYKDHVPIATPDANTIRSIGNVIMDFPEIQNEFLSALINRIAEVKVTNKYYTNPMNVFKKGKLNFGEVIEDIFIDLAHAKNYSPERAETTVFQREFPDVKSAFYVMNYQKYYKQTVQPYDLENAFLNINADSSFIEKIVATMFTSMEQDEFLTFKYMLAYRIINGLMRPFEIPAVTKENMNDIVEAIQTVSDDMTFMKPDYNLVGVNNFSLKEDQYLIVSAKFNAKRNVEVLASAFNMDKVEFLGHIKLIDSFGLHAFLLRVLTSDFSDKRRCRILEFIKGKSGEYTSHTSHLGTTTTQELSVKGVVLGINGSDLQQGVLINDGSATTGLTSYLIANLEHTRTTGSGRGRSHRNGRRSLSHRNSRGGSGGSDGSVVNGLHSCSPF